MQSAETDGITRQPKETRNEEASSRTAAASFLFAERFSLSALRTVTVMTLEEEIYFCVAAAAGLRRSESLQSRSPANGAGVKRAKIAFSKRV